MPRPGAPRLGARWAYPPDVARSVAATTKSWSPRGRLERGVLSAGGLHQTADLMSDADVLTRLLHAIDRLDWAAARACFADELATDYSSLWGGEPESLSADDLISRWQEFAATLAATQHVTGPIIALNGHAETHVVARHWLPNGDLWTVYGHYMARIVDDRIAELELQTFHAGGHDGLPNITARRP